MQKSRVVNKEILLIKMQSYFNLLKVYQKKYQIGAKWLLFILLVSNSVLLSRTTQAKTDASYETKAKRVYGMVKYTDWKTRKSLTLCVYQPNPFKGALKQQTQGKRIKNKNVKTISINATAHIKNCQLLFISKQIKGQKLSDILQVAKKNKGILTVGESNAFFRTGGMINFINAKGQFEINHQAIKKAGLKISSQLAKLAK